MTGEAGFHVRLVQQGAEFAEERGDDAPEYIMAEDRRRLFHTEAEAIEAGQTYVAGRPKLTYLVEPAAA